jgi:hypothetical protein
VGRPRWIRDGAGGWAGRRIDRGDHGFAQRFSREPDETDYRGASYSTFTSTHFLRSVNSCPTTWRCERRVAHGPTHRFCHRHQEYSHAKPPIQLWALPEELWVDDLCLMQVEGDSKYHRLWSASGNPSGARLPSPLPRATGTGKQGGSGVASRPVFCFPVIPLRLRSHPAGLPSAASRVRRIGKRCIPGDSR